MQKFPDVTDIKEDGNPAIRLFGRRYYKDQTPVEYLAEFLLAFSSPKRKNGEFNHSFLGISEDSSSPEYWPEDRIALKLFSFFAASKFDTRHPVHVECYKQGLELIKEKISSDQEKKDFDVHLIQSLFEGFVGVAKNRTWATQAFLPASDCLLAREVGWRHSGANGAAKIINGDWDKLKDFFKITDHNFMARGGELLFLQLVNLFLNIDDPCVVNITKSKDYAHLKIDISLRKDVESGLSAMLKEGEKDFGRLANFVENCLTDFNLKNIAGTGAAKFGWVPKQSITESLLFASEIRNICSSSHSSLQKTELLQSLCCMHVLRSLCFQARRLDFKNNKGSVFSGFIGNYAWVVCSQDTELAGESRKIAQEGNRHVEQMLFRILREPSAYSGDSPISESDLSSADENVYKLFRKLGKDIGLIIPRTGQYQRLVLPPHLIRFLVYSLIEPGGRITLFEFYRRIFAHYGIAIASREQAIALEWIRGVEGGLSVSGDALWFEDELQRGGVLIELSDAVSMVENPYK